MDGRGRCLDNVFVVRLCRGLKYEDIYLRDYEDGLELENGLFNWFAHYNDERPHQALGVRHAPGSVSLSRIARRQAGTVGIEIRPPAAVR